MRLIRPHDRSMMSRIGRHVARLMLLPLLYVSVASAQSTGSIQAQSCLWGARKALGPGAAVLKCAHLAGAPGLGCVAAVRLRQFPDTADGIPVSKLVVLRQVSSSRWATELTADRNWIRNQAGYLGFDADSSIDPSYRITGYRVSFQDRNSDDVPGFTIFLYYLTPGGENDGLPVEVSWNPPVGRFQWFAYEAEPHGFRSETKNPPRIRTSRKQVALVYCGRRSNVGGDAHDARLANRIAAG